MDYGHATQTNNDTFFTDGVGMQAKNTDDIEVKDNLDLSNKSISWDESEPGEPNKNKNSQEIDNPQIKTQESLASRGPDSSNGVQLGEIVDLKMPPGSGDKHTDDAKIIEASFNRTAFRTTGDKLNIDAIKELDAEISKLNQTGNISDFYNHAREAMEANIDNSYGRKLAT